MPSDEERIITEIKKMHPDADHFSFEKVGGLFIGGQAYYVDFQSPTVEEPFYYALVDKDGVTIYTDGIEVLKALQAILDKRRSFWQRISDFDFTDAVAAVIAILVSLTFVGLMIFRTDGAGKEFLAIFSLIVGYYFGKQKPAK